MKQKKLKCQEVGIMKMKIDIKIFYRQKKKMYKKIVKREYPSKFDKILLDLEIKWRLIDINNHLYKKLIKKIPNF